jgi:hypothetical protein
MREEMRENREWEGERQQETSRAAATAAQASGGEEKDQDEKQKRDGGELRFGGGQEARSYEEIAGADLEASGITGAADHAVGSVQRPLR